MAPTGGRFPGEVIVSDSVAGGVARALDCLQVLSSAGGCVPPWAGAHPSAARQAIATGLETDESAERLYRDVMARRLTGSATSWRGA
ncbi:hypothetical protein ACWERW_35490 [Streptomyces sp. NPDC004012]